MFIWKENVGRHPRLWLLVSLFTQPVDVAIRKRLSLMCRRWQAQNAWNGLFPGRFGHTVRDWLSVAVTRHYGTVRTAPQTPEAHEDDHIWYTDDILSLLWQHRLIFLLWHSSPCGCYSSQIYHFNGEVVRPENYLRDECIIVCSFGIDQMSPCSNRLFHNESHTMS